MTSTKKMPEYERQRLENIRRNNEMIAALKLQTRAAELFSASKRQKIETKTYKTPKVKKPKDEAPVVIRRSLRTRGLGPESKGLCDDEIDNSAAVTKSSESKVSPREVRPISMKDAHHGCGSNATFIGTISKCFSKKEMDYPSVKVLGGVEVCDMKPKNESDVGMGEDVVRAKCRSGSKCSSETLANAGSLKMEEKTAVDLPGNPVLLKQQCGYTKQEKEELVDVKLEDNDSIDLPGNPMVKQHRGDTKQEKEELGDNMPSNLEPKGEGKHMALLDVGSLVLKEENIARVVPGRVLTVKFLPAANTRMVVVGNRLGNVGFWNMNPGEDEDEGLYLYCAHTAAVSGISFPHFECSKMFTCSYDGFIRMMDVEKEMFDLMYDSKYPLYSICQQPSDAKCVYFGEYQGAVKFLDTRAGNSSSSWCLHKDKINSIDFHPQNPFIMATCSSDGTACIWDIRNIGSDRLKNLRVVDHEKAVHSAYFSPSGSFLASTSTDNSVGLVSGVNFQGTASVHHDNQTSFWISTFRSIWGWDDSYLFIGNTNRAVDIISVVEKRTVVSLVSPYMTAIPCRFAAHPCEVGVLAGATAGGQVYVWTPQ